jgi:hypothetical protein
MALPHPFQGHLSLTLVAGAVVLMVVVLLVQAAQEVEVRVD